MKIARDRNLKLDVERVRANSDRRCASPKCDVLIVGGEDYAKVHIPTQSRFHNGRSHWPQEKDLHFRCLPDDLKPLKRFFEDQLV